MHGILSFIFFCQEIYFLNRTRLHVLQYKYMAGNHLKCHNPQWRNPGVDKHKKIHRVSLFSIHHFENNLKLIYCKCHLFWWKKSIYACCWHLKVFINGYSAVLRTGNDGAQYVITFTIGYIYHTIYKCFYQTIYHFNNYKKNNSILDGLWESLLLSRVNPCLLQGEMCDWGGIKLFQSTKENGVKITGMASTTGARLVAGC